MVFVETTPLKVKEVSLLSYVNFRVVSEVDELGGEG